uniref:Uncharacterized protein n=1 Tax=Setaria digitata TaxID=48799 RepID=A0A915Q5A7_9BILA
MLTVNITKKTLDPVHRGRCATISIDNRVLKTVPCDQTPDFDFTNRFICQRSDEQHYEHQKKNNPLYEFFEQLINKSQNDAMAKSEARPAQLQGVRTQVADVQEKKENFLSLINERKENITENNDEDRFSKIREMITKETLTLVDPDVQGKSQADFFADSKKGRTAKNKIANGNKHMLQAKNFLKERKSAVRDDNEKNKSAQTCEIKSDSENNVNISSDSPNVLKQSVRLPSKFCKENDTAQKDPHKWYERFGDIFRNLNLFLKQENSSDLRALLDNNDTNKTLVERLKEALHAKNNTNLSKPHATQKKKMLQNAIDDEQEFSDGVQDHFSNTLGRETDDSSGVLHSQKVEGKATYTESVYETIKLDEIYEREELARHLETSKNRIYEEIRKKLENMLTEHLRNLSDVDISTTSKSDEIRKEITPKIGGKQIYQKEVTVSQHAAQEQKAEPSLLFTDLKKKETEQAISTLPTFINNSRGTSKISIKLSNRTEIEPRVLEVLLLHPNNERPMEINPT